MQSRRNSSFPETLAATIEQTHPTDVPALLSFSFGAVSESAWQQIVSHGDAVLARDNNGTIVGYYLVNQLAHSADTSLQERLLAARNVLCNRFKFDERVVTFGAHVQIGAAWEGTPLRPQLLRELLRSIGLRYRCLFTVVQLSARIEMEALTSEGWRCFREEDDVCYMMLDVARTLRQLASTLVLHFPHRAEEPKASARFWP